MRSPVLVALVSLLLITAPPVSAQRNWLAGPVTESRLAASLDAASWRNAQRRHIDSALAALSPEVKTALLRRAEEFLSFRWPNLPATVFLQYGENGNRTHYQDIRAQRRQALSALVVGELLEPNGRFLPQIINGIWAVSEESTWAYPAHLGLQHHYTPLPDPREKVVDLGAGSTAAMMSWIYFLLKDSLAAVSPVIPERIRFELERRILRPFLDRDDFWWMGLHGQRVNNWNPFVNGKVLLTALLAGNDDAMQDSVVHKTMRSVDCFINQYPEDGGCDEGPSYWSMAGGALIKYLQWLDGATGTQVRITDRPLIRAIGSYIYKVHIAGDAFVDFADAHPFMMPDVPAVFGYGEACRSDTLRGFAAYFARQRGDPVSGLSGRATDLESFIDYLEIWRSLENTPPRQPLLRQSWLPNLQVLTARTAAGTDSGLFLAAKGGNNAESHNHNDVGNFIVYVNGQPAIVDIGVGTYTRETFSADRYRIFTMQSAWHNLPTINGTEQRAGKSFRAREVSFRSGDGALKLSMDIAGAYPPEAAVKSWVRTWDFRGGRLTLEDRYRLGKVKDTTFLSLITPAAVRVDGGHIRIGSGAGQLVVGFDPSVLQATVEEKPLKDPSLLHSWPHSLRRIRLRILHPALSGAYQLHFSAAAGGAKASD